MKFATGCFTKKPKNFRAISTGENNEKSPYKVRKRLVFRLSTICILKQIDDNFEISKTVNLNLVCTLFILFLISITISKT